MKNEILFRQVEQDLCHRSSACSHVKDKHKKLFALLTEIIQCLTAFDIPFGQLDSGKMFDVTCARLFPFPGPVTSPTRKNEIALSFFRSESNLSPRFSVAPDTNVEEQGITKLMG